MFGNNLKAARKKAGFTQKEAAEKLNMAQQSYWAYENGKSSPNTDTLRRISTLFNIDISELLSETESYMPVGIEKLPKFVKAPIIGNTHCGNPMLAIEEPDPETIDIPIEFEGCCVFRCIGDSMTGAHIYNGDMVLIRPQPTADNGTIVMVSIENEFGEYESTLKTYYKYDNVLILRPENTAYSELVFKNQEMNRVHIIGKAVGGIYHITRG